MTRRARGGPGGGIILILVSGVVALLLLLAGILFNLLRMSRAVAAGAVASSRARLAAEGGMEYAAARLAGEGYPRYSANPADRGDDWTDRQGTGVGGQGSDNPSYSHGESWLDDGDGRFEPGEAFRDEDADGAFSACSGRLRGGPRFSLRIACEEGKIPLNAAQMYRPVGGAYAEAEWMQVAGTSAWTDFPGTVSLARVLNNLGSVLRDPASGAIAIPARRWDVPTSGEPLAASWLGYDLIMNRPLRYGAWGDVERVMGGLGQGYTAAELAFLTPHVSLGPYAGTGGGGRIRADSPFPTPRYVPVSFWTASRETLASLWMYVMTANPYASIDSQGRLHFNDFCGEPDGAAKTCPHSGLRFDQVQLILWPEEALALADFSIAHRRTGDRSWEGFRRALSASAPALFAGDFAALGVPVPGQSPAFRRNWVQAKANLAYQAVAMDPYPYRGIRHNLAAWATGGIDADPAPGFQPQPVIGFDSLHHLMYPRIYDPSGLQGAPQFQAFAPTTPPYGLPAFNTMAPESKTSHRVHPRGLPLGLTLAPPAAFSVSSRGAAGRGGGAVELSGGLVLGRMELATQEDFEAFRPSPSWVAAAGIERVDLPSAWERRGAAGPNLPGTCVSLPRWNVRSQSTNPGALGGFSRTYGALVPADVEGGLSGADLYWPLSEDFNGEADAATPPAPGLELWASYSSYVARQNIAAGPPATTGWPPSKFRLPAELYSSPTEEPVVVSRPFGITSGSLVFQCPGFDPPKYSTGIGSMAELVKTFTMEGWIGPDSRLILAPPGNLGGEPPPATDRRIEVSARRGWQDSLDNVGTYVRFYVRWFTGGKKPGPQTVSTGDQEFGPREWFIPDDPARPGWTCHVVVTGELTGTGASYTSAHGTRFCVYVDGVKLLDENWIGSPPVMTYMHSRGLIVPNGWEELSIRAADEIRLSGAVRPPVGPPPDRFRRDGLYISPLYRFEGMGRLGLVQWSGVVPPGYGSPVSVEAVPCDAAGVEGVPVPLPGGSGAVNDLSALGMPRCRAFRYKVRFDGGPAGTMFDAPVFESIWLRFHAGGGPAWAAWRIGG